MKKLLLILLFLAPCLHAQSIIQDEYVEHWHPQPFPGLPPFIDCYVYYDINTKLLTGVKWDGTYCLTPGGGGGGGSTNINPGTPYQITRYDPTGLNIQNSSIYDNPAVGPSEATSGISVEGQFLARYFVNSPGNGTIINQLVCADPAVTTFTAATVCPVSSQGVKGIADYGSGGSGNVRVAMSGYHGCVFDNQTVVNDWVAASSSIPGDCSDVGPVKVPNVQIIGVATSLNSGSGTLATVDLFTGDVIAPGSSGGSGNVGNCGSPNSNAFYLLAGTTVNCDPLVTDDNAGNTTMRSAGFTGSGAGFVYFVQGTAPTLAASNAAYVYAPTTILSSLGFVLRGTLPTNGDCVNFIVSGSTYSLGDSGSGCGAGGGGVSTFSAGNLSPLFTTSVANPSTTPALTFSLSNAAANTYFGNSSNSSGAPSYISMTACANDGSHALTYTNGTGFVCTAVTGGTVTSVGLSINSASSSGPFAVTGSPVTTSGTLNLNATLQGTDTKLLTSGTVSGTGAALCTDSNGGATTSGCSSGVTIQTNTVNNTSQTTLNFTNSPTITASNPSGGVEQFSINGAGTLSNPSTPTVTPTGTTGATSYTYGVVGCEDISCTYHSAISATGSTSTGNATLTTSNYNALTLYGDTTYGYRGYIVCRLTGGATQGVITNGLLAGKKFNDTGLGGNSANCSTLYASNTTLTYPFCLGTALPGYPSVPGAPCGVDGPPLSPNALDDEMTQTYGAPGDVNDPFWTWGNQNSATATWSNGTIIFKTDTTSAWEYLTMPLPSAPYTFEVFVDEQAWGVTGANGCFIGFRESGTTKVAIIGLDYEQAAGSTSGGGGYIWMIHNTTGNTPGGTITYQPYGTNAAYFKMQNDGSSHIVYYTSPSTNGIQFTQASSQAITTPFTTAPNQLIIGGYSTATVPTTCTFDFSRRTQ